MSYTINYTDVANKGTITVEDGTINRETTLGFPGRNTTSYGAVVAENFLHLLENFAATTAPSQPSEGQLWYDSTLGVEALKVYNGTNWVNTSTLTDITLNGAINITGSVNITDVLNLKPLNSLTTGSVGDLAVSGSSLFFYNGNWSKIV